LTIVHRPHGGAGLLMKRVLAVEHPEKDARIQQYSHLVMIRINVGAREISRERRERFRISREEIIQRLIKISG
jgi:hypothetical protein